MALMSGCVLLCVLLFLHCISSTEVQRDMDSWLIGFEPISIDGAAVTPPCRVFRVLGAPNEALEDRFQPETTSKTAESSMKPVTSSHTPNPSRSSASDWRLAKLPARSASSRLMEALQTHKLVYSWNILSNQRRSDSSSSSEEE